MKLDTLCKDFEILGWIVYNQAIVYKRQNFFNPCPAE